MTKKLVLLFIDGVGLGDDTAENPVRELFSDFLDGSRLVRRSEALHCAEAVMIPTDAVMGVSGTPQSATGQASIFTGLNTQKMLGTHIPAFPSDRLAVLVEQRSLMRVLRDAGIRVTSANLYSREFFQKRESARRNLFPVSTLTIRASGVPFRYPDDYRAGKAVFADITNELLRSRGWDVPLSTPEEAAGRMARIVEEADFLFFEYFMTDLHGHKRNGEAVRACVDILSRFTRELWLRIRSPHTGILVVSDHGNAEDMVVGDHTLNLVPTILIGGTEADRASMATAVRDLSDVYRAVLAWFGVSFPREGAGSSPSADV